MKELTIDIREATLEDSQAIAYVHVESWRTSYAGIVPNSYLDNLQYQDREAMWARILSDTSGGDTHTYVAVDQSTGEVIGFTSGGPSRTKEPESLGKGEIYAIYLLKSYQGLGIGQQLFEASRYHLQSCNHLPFMLWVLEKNPSRRFYEKMQGRVVGQANTTIGDTVLEELAFAWES